MEVSHVVEGQMAFPFRCPPFAERQQSRQSAVSRPVGGQEHRARSLGQRHLGPDEQLQSQRLRGGMGPHDSRQTVPVGDRQRRVFQFGRSLHEFIRMRCGPQERVIRLTVQLGVGGVRRTTRYRRIGDDTRPNFREGDLGHAAPQSNSLSRTTRAETSGHF